MPLLALSCKKLRFQTQLCNSFYMLMQKSVNFNHLAICFIKGNYFRIHFWYMIKNEGINLLKNANLTEKSENYRM